MDDSTPMLTKKRYLEGPLYRFLHQLLYLYDAGAMHQAFGRQGVH
jgi:hypothetical protein